jgi:hypothetical protein
MDFSSFNAGMTTDTDMAIASTKGVGWAGAYAGDFSFSGGQVSNHAIEDSL